MSARKKRWLLRDPAPPAFLAAHGDLPPLVATLLYQRGYQDRPAIDAFLAEDYRVSRLDPFLLAGMRQAAERIVAAVRDAEPIAVYGDFDTDGVTAVALLMQAISAMGGEIQPYIPHRASEGYGLNTDAIDALAAEGVRLLITVDCGISNAREVAYARTLGVDVIVTDHHTPPPQLPEAVAVVNPRQPGCPYPYKQLVGVGIAYKLVQALAQLGLRPSALRRDDLLDVVALGTVADMGPLTGENRSLVKAGLAAIHGTQRPGLRALIASAGLAQESITAADIGFGLAPRLNAAGRLDHATRAYQLLLADDEAAAQHIAAELSQANRRRQDLTKDVQQAARAQAETLGKAANRIIVLDDAEYPAGVVGLVAARLADDFGRPVLLLERGVEFSRGSARSVPGFNIVEALASCADLLDRYGGHAAAAGCTVATTNVPELERRLLAYAEQHLPDDLLSPAIQIDAEVPLSALSLDLLRQLKRLEPFGQANPEPVLVSRRVRVAGAWPKGSEGQHLKLRLDDGQGGTPVEGMAWRLGHLAGHFQKPINVDVVYVLEQNTWNGNQALQLNIKDFRSVK
jgi:single-stranded-DNA-specific exonuclease